MLLAFYIQIYYHSCILTIYIDHVSKLALVVSKMSSCKVRTSPYYFTMAKSLVDDISLTEIINPNTAPVGLYVFHKQS